MAAILGVSALYHDAAAALVVDGQLVAAAQEERFTRRKHDYEFPAQAVRYCLEQAGLAPDQLDFVGFYDKPYLKFERLLETYLAYAPRGFRSFLQAMPLWLRQKLHLPRELRAGLDGRFRKRFVFTEHHESHAASAFFPSPFQEAALLTIDGVGEWATATCGYGRDNRITLTHQLNFPHSPGLLYSAFTYYCGFTVNSGEYKLMGLAPYGEPTYVDLILDNLIDLKDDGSFRMDMSYFNYGAGQTMTSRKFERLFGEPPRKPDTRLTQRDMDIAASIQKVIEEIMLRMARHVHAETKMKNLCLAGGVALNCVGNGRILREGPFDDVWIQPAAGDAGGALGVAQFIWYQLLGNPRQAQPRDAQRASLLGPSFSDEEIGEFLAASGAAYDYVPDDNALVDLVSRDIAAGKVIGWMQGRMEFGPRALGSRSILGDARLADSQRVINMKVKFREGFRPFAPIVLEEHAHEFFDLKAGQQSPYMLLVAPVREEKRLPIPGEHSSARGIDKLKLRRSVVPAVTHVDYSARVQTVDRQRHGLLRRLMERFEEQTGCPVMLNTSFNLGFEPIVCTPAEAFRTFMGSNIDTLCMGHYLLTKQAQPAFISDPSPAGRHATLAPLLGSPCHDAELDFDGPIASCRKCGATFRQLDGIWSFIVPHSRPAAAAEVENFAADESATSGTEQDESVRALLENARRDPFARTLDESIAPNTTVLEVGCGAGQLSNFLGITCRRVVGIDVSLPALRAAERFRANNGLDRVTFLHMDLFHPCFRPEQFDVIVCDAVLHQTADPRSGFERLLPLLKPGGHIVVGLHGKYSGIAAAVRRRLTGRVGNSRKAYESKHSVDEILAWFDQCGLQFVRGLPSVLPTNPPLHGSNLFEPEPRGTKLDHALISLRDALTGGIEDALIRMVARKPGGHAPRPVAIPHPHRTSAARAFTG